MRLTPLREHSGKFEVGQYVLVDERDDVLGNTIRLHPLSLLSMGQITKVTKTQITVNHLLRFTIRTGRLVRSGEQRYNDARAYLMDANGKAVAVEYRRIKSAKQERDNLRTRLHGALEKIGEWRADGKPRWDEMPIDLMRTITELVEEEAKKKKAQAEERE